MQTQFPVSCFTSQFEGFFSEDTLSQIFAMPVTQASVSFNPQLQERRRFGANADFHQNNPMQCNISLNGIVDVGSNFALLDEAHTSAANSRYDNIKIGSNVYRKCYVTDYSFQSQPFAPITFSINVISYDPPTGENITGFTMSAPVSTNATMALGHSSYLSGYNHSVVAAVKYSRTRNWSPVFKLGQINSSDCLLDSDVKEMSIQGTGLDPFINFESNTLASDMEFLIRAENEVSKSANFRALMNSGAQIISQDYNVNETLQTNITIKEIVV